ncbi:pantoate--beta-alanine ligase [Patiriisocius hiemis]|uniref:Pantothenate synthetase n=1 Tax=Patiriisocius hiemis TaxID=3075604 RepID=A0ABU2YEN0_9FLAO|nr:pantoate--beta-alanine ligase [Constantimarinum sp. W242]MDT0556467.1 pantoate--beta-alanine ligase [Constantimarinum sp. W242]
MKIFYTKAALSKNLKTIKPSKKIGLVPTMGALHKGHLSLIEQSIVDNDHTIVSVFVNPTQFDNVSDLKKYPRTLEEDVNLIKSLNSKVFIFAPEAEDLYGGDVVSRKFNFGAIANEMEGKHRKGHFDGVGTVVSLLLKAVKPTHAYFGEKDFQQLQIVRKLVEIEQIDTTIKGCPIVREQNGIALSSRNKRLTQEQFEAATLISQSLKEAKKLFKTTSINKITNHIKAKFNASSHLELEYFEIANVKTLKTASRKRKGNEYRGFIAAFAGEVRLIDNMALN